MFFILISISKCVGPIFSVPGILYSNLYSTITNPLNFPECEKFPKSKTQIWPIPNTTQTTYEENWKCISTLLDTISYENGSIGSPEGVIIESDPITKSKVPYFSKFDNTFRVYYDWIHFYTGTNSTFQALKEKIQHEVEQTKNHEKAIISGYSLGGAFVRYFLTHYVDEEWKSKYIEFAMFFAAGVGGSFFSSASIGVGKMFGILDMDKKAVNSPFIRHMPSLYSMLPNFPTNKRKSIFNGRPFGASEIFNEMIKISEESKGEIIEFKNKNKENFSVNFSVVIDDTSKKIYNANLPFLEEDILDPGVRSLIVFNSGMKVICGFNITQINPHHYEYEIFECGGDNIISSDGVEYASKHWKNVVFHDFNSTNHKFLHEEISFSKELADYIIEFIGDDNTEL